MGLGPNNMAACYTRKEDKMKWKHAYCLPQLCMAILEAEESDAHSHFLVHSDANDHGIQLDLVCSRLDHIRGYNTEGPEHVQSIQI